MRDLSSGAVAHRRSVLIVEDEPLLRELLGSALERREFEVVTAGSPSEARRAFRALDPDGIVMDVDLGPGPNGFDLAESLLAEETGAAVVFLTNLPDARFAGRAADDLPPGIAYLRKSAVHDIDLLARTLDATMRGAVDAQIRHDRDPARPLSGLTHRQIEVLRLLALGYTNARIAETRGTTEKAVEKTIARAMTVLGADAGADQNVRVALARQYAGLAGEPLPLPLHEEGDAPIP